VLTQSVEHQDVRGGEIADMNGLPTAPRWHLRRGYVHVSDLAPRTSWCSTLGQHDKLIYNLATGRGFSVREVRRNCSPCDASRFRARVPATWRSGSLVAGSERIKRDLHWKPQFPELESIVRSAGFGVESTRTAMLQRLNGRPISTVKTKGSTHDPSHPRRDFLAAMTTLAAASPSPHARFLRATCFIRPWIWRISTRR